MVVCGSKGAVGKPKRYGPSDAVAERQHGHAPRAETHLPIGGMGTRRPFDGLNYAECIVLSISNS